MKNSLAKNSLANKLNLGRAVMVSAIALIGFATTAQAGFEWRGPLEAPRAPVAPQAAPAQGDIMAPVTSWDGTTDVTPEWNESVAAPVAEVSAAPVDQAPAAPSPALAPFVAQTPLPEPVDSGDVLTGFGSDLPLVIALQQVVPPGYQYSFSEGVNLGQPVSWQGGKAWQNVLSDMLAKEGLGYRVQGNVVVVGYFPPEETVPATNMMQAPETTTAAPATQIDWHDASAADAAPAMGEPVTIRRQRPGVTKSAPEAQPEAQVAPADAAPAPAAEMTAETETYAAPVTADTATPAWQTATDRTAGSRAMSYPPEKSSSAPIAVTSEPPAAQNKISEAQAPLSAPPPMDMGVMSQNPPADETAPVDITAAEAPASDNRAAEEELTAAEAAPAPAETVAPTPEKTAAAVHDGAWNGQKGATLRDTLKTWSDSAGVELYWSIDYDYRLKKNVELDGSYDQAVAALLDQFAEVRPQPYGQLHQGKDGPRVLVVRSYDLTP